jgi:hypothetical protein
MHSLPAMGFTLSPDSAKADGVAFPAGGDEAGNHLSRLVLGKQELPGRLVLVDGLFVPADGQGS